MPNLISRYKKKQQSVTCTMIAVSQYMTSVTESECGQNNLFVTELEENPYDLPPKKVSVD